MSKLPVKESASKNKRGLRHWRDIESNPFAMFLRGRSSLHREVDRFFEDFWNNSGESSLLSPWSDATLLPLIDVTEDEHAYHIDVELPGMDQDDVEVSYSDGLLTIRGEKKDEKEERQEGYFRSERSFGSFSRAVSIPGEVDDSKIKASFKKGVLNVQLPKSKEAQKKVKKISVQSA